MPTMPTTQSNLSVLCLIIFEDFAISPFFAHDVEFVGENVRYPCVAHHHYCPACLIFSKPSLPLVYVKSGYSQTEGAYEVDVSNNKKRLLMLMSPKKKRLLMLIPQQKKRLLMPSQRGGSEGGREENKPDDQGEGGEQNGRPGGGKRTK